MVMPFIIYCVALTALMWLAGAIISDSASPHARAAGHADRGGDDRILGSLPGPRAASSGSWQLIWTPVTSGWKRICALLAIILAHCAVLFLYAVGATTQTAIIVASIVQLPIAFLVAVRGVAQDRSVHP